MSTQLSFGAPSQEHLLATSLGEIAVDHSGPPSSIYSSTSTIRAPISDISYARISKYSLMTAIRSRMGEGQKRKPISSLSSVTTLGDFHFSDSTSILVRDLNESASLLIYEGFHVSHDGRVSWSESHKLHPRNWAVRRKVYDTGVMFVLEFFTTMVSSTGTLTAIEASQELGVSKDVAITIFTTTYLLAQAAGSLVFSSYTNSYGRRPTYVASAVIFAVASVLVGLPGGIPIILIGRLLSGLASAIPGVVLSGSVEDMWDIKARIWAINLWVMAGVSGIAAAPIFATAINSSMGWRWVYYMAAILGTVLATAICFIKESRPSRVLHTYLNTNFALDGFVADSTDIMPSFGVFVRNGLKKPVILLCTGPILLIVTVMFASVYGFGYLITGALSDIYTGFGYSAMEGAAVYLLLGFGACLSLIVRLFDIRSATKRERRGEVLAAEDKLLGFYFAAPAQAAAFWVFAWTIPPHGSHISSVVSVISIVPMGFAMNEFGYVLMGYIVDMYGSEAGAACAPLGTFRAILSAVLPIMGRQMFSTLDNNISISILATIVSIYVVIAVAFYIYSTSYLKNGDKRWCRTRDRKDATKRGRKTWKGEQNIALGVHMGSVSLEENVL